MKNDDPAERSMRGLIRKGQQAIWSLENQPMRRKDRLINQRVMWDDLTKNIRFLVNKVNASNFCHITQQLLSLNLLWGRGLFCNAVLRSISESNSDSAAVVAFMVSILNSKFPDVGLLMVKRALNQFRIALHNENKDKLVSIVKFLAYLINYGVVHGRLRYELLSLLDAEVADILLQKGCTGSLKRSHVVSKSINLYDLTVLRQIKEARAKTTQMEMFVDDDDDDQVTHEVSMFHDLDCEMELNVFRPDTNYLTNDDRLQLVMHVNNSR